MRGGTNSAARSFIVTYFSPNSVRQTAVIEFYLIDLQNHRAVDMKGKC